MESMEAGFEDKLLRSKIIEIYDEEDEDFEELEETPLPRVSCWLGVDGKTHHVVMVVMDYDPKNNNKSQFDDACPICFQALSSHGKHQICCLPCGHIYGSSCIKKWLLQRSSLGRGKCPQCNKLCTHKDVILLYGGAHQKAASSARYYPFTKQGFIDFKAHEMLRRADAEKNFNIDIQRQLDVATLQNDVKHQWIELESWFDDLVEKLEDKTGQAADALEQQVDALTEQLNALGHQFIVLQRRFVVLDKRTDIFKLRLEEYSQRLKFFNEMYKEHLAQQQQKKKKKMEKEEDINP